jgi:hypothetical protein
MGSTPIGAFWPWRRCHAGEAGIANLTPAGDCKMLRGGGRLRARRRSPPELIRLIKGKLAR